MSIFAQRVAPIQVSYLGYPGTSGTNFIDFIFADKILIPEESKKYYSEKIIYLPNTYQTRDCSLKISDKIFEREELDLPKNAFVFCCFNQNYKITPNLFDIWMRLLKIVEGSILWLLEDNLTAVKNLKKEAEKKRLTQKELSLRNVCLCLNIWQDIDVQISLLILFHMVLIQHVVMLYGLVYQLLL